MTHVEQGTMRRGLRLLTAAVAVAVLALTAAGSATASNVIGPPSGVEIEQLLRDTLADADAGPPSMVGHRGALLLDFDMQMIERIAGNRWLVVAELDLYFQEQHRSVLGFERRRKGLYRMWVERDGETWRLSRFHPMGRVLPLPSDA